MATVIFTSYRGPGNQSITAREPLVSPLKPGVLYVQDIFRGGAMTEAEALCRGLLQNAAARQSVVARVGPEEASADYLAGFSAGVDSGYVAALALALGVMTGESPTALIEDAQSQAAVDATFPFELYIEEAS